MTGNGHFAFLCDTPYQVLGAVNFVANNVKGSAAHSDIFVYRQFGGAEAVSGRLAKSGLFRGQAYGVKLYRNNKAWYTKLRTIYRVLFPQRVLYTHLVNKSATVEESYNYLVMFFFTQFTLGFRQRYPQAQVLLLEDGTGSYFGDIEKRLPFGCV